MSKQFQWYDLKVSLKGHFLNNLDAVLSLKTTNEQTNKIKIKIKKRRKKNEETNNVTLVTSNIY